MISPTESTAPLLLYFDKDNRLQVGTWNQDFTKQNMAFFKFGSVVGFTYSSGTDPWGADDLRFNPTSTPDATFAASYTSIPYWGSWTPVTPAAKPTTYGVNNPDTVDFISRTTGDSAYHTLTNVQSGRGDPCKLVGYTAEQVSKWTEATFPTTTTYRLPTNPENSEFVGYDHDNDGVVSGVAGNTVNIGSTYVTKNAGDPPTGTFLKSTPVGAVMPFAGHRTGDGTGSHWDVDGNLWSSTPGGTNAGYLLLFSTYVTPSYNWSGNGSIPVRCVRAD